MPRLIDSFLRSLPVYQSKQVLTLLNQLRSTGRARTVEESRRLLTELTEALKNRDISQPLLAVDPARPGDLVSSYTQQQMLRAGQSDINTAFSTIDTISTLLENQDQVIKIDYLSKLQAALDALEQNIIRFEWQHLNRYDGLNNGRYYRFNSDLNYTPRAALSRVSGLFRDRRAYLDLGTEFDCIPSRFDEKITLPVERSIEVVPAQVRKLDTSSGSTSEIDVSFPGNDISNLLGASTGRYWIHEVLWDTPTPEGAILYLEFYFDSYAPINTIAIEPASATGMWLDQVDLYTYGDTIETVLSDSRFLRGNVKLTFDSKTTRRAVLKFRQSAYSKQEYRYRDDTGIYERIVNPLRSGPTTGPLAGSAFDLSTSISDASAVVTSRTARDLAGLELAYDPTVIYKYDYLFGFDNVRFFNTQYRDTGIFVTDTIHSTDTYAVACSVEDEIVDSSSAEVWCLKLNYDFDGNLIDSETFEVPEVRPSTTKLITDERIVVPASGEGQSRFYPDWGLLVPVVKQDGVALTSTEYSVSIDGSTWTAGSTPSGTATTPHKYRISINDYDRSSVYTITYIMRLSTSDLSTKYYLNDEETAYVRPDGLVGFNKERARSSIASSDIYGVLILRQNSPSNRSISGGVKSFRFLVGDSSVSSES